MTSARALNEEERNVRCGVCEICARNFSIECACAWSAKTIRGGTYQIHGICMHACMPSKQRANRSARAVIERGEILLTVEVQDQQSLFTQGRFSIDYGRARSLQRTATHIRRHEREHREQKPQNALSAAIRRVWEKNVQRPAKRTTL